jgi:hypothetical protein
MDCGMLSLAPNHSSSFYLLHYVQQTRKNTRHAKRRGKKKPLKQIKSPIHFEKTEQASEPDMT